MYKYLSMTCLAISLITTIIVFFTVLILKSSVVIKLLPIIIVVIVLLAMFGVLFSIKPTWNSLKKGEKEWRNNQNQSNSPTSHGN